MNNIKLGTLLFLLFIIIHQPVMPSITTTDYINPADGYNFTEIDRHALNAPASLKDSIKSLALYLSEPTRNDLEKARAIFIWIATNVYYDIEGYRTHDYGDISPEGVLKSGKAVCSGYAGLFKTLAENMGLDCIEISGICKGLGYKTGEKMIKKSNHAWNAVKINGKYHLIDSTWGAGFVMNNNYYHKTNEYYFCVAPEELIYTHFPLNSNLQLLNVPVKFETFQNMADVESEFFTLGFNISSISHPSNTITISDKNEIIISLNGESDSEIMATLSKGDNKIPGSTFVETGIGKFRIKARIPETGEFFLRIYAQNKEENENCYSMIIQYKINCKTPVKSYWNYPMIYSAYNSSKTIIYSPLKKELTKNTYHTFSLKVPGAKDVMIVLNDKEWIPLTRDDNNVFSGEVLITGETIKVYARFADESNFSGLAEYKGI